MEMKAYKGEERLRKINENTQQGEKMLGEIHANTEKGKKQNEIGK